MTADARVVPHNLAAERSLLGAMMMSRDAIAAGVETCTADDFYRPAHGHIFTAIWNLYSRGEGADPVTVADELARAGLLAQCGDLPELLGIQGDTVAISNAPNYARIVEELALLRRLIGAGAEIRELGYQLPDDVADTLDRAERLVFDIAQRRVTDTMASSAEIAAEAIERLEVLATSDEHITGLRTGFVDLDEMLTGLQPSNLIIVGARPSVGKTAFALCAAAHASIHAAKPVAFFSLEMNHGEIMQRLFALDGRIDLNRLRTGRLQESDWPKLSGANARLSEAPLHIDDNSELTVMDMRAKARRLQSRLNRPLGLIVVDYVQLMTGRRTAENRQVEVSEISRGLKILSRDLEVPVVALCQLNRSLEARADKRPTLADLRESGSLEQDADVVVFLYRDEVYNSDSPHRGTAEVIVAKQRNGPTGTVKLAYLDRYTRFANMARLAPTEPPAVPRQQALA